MIARLILTVDARYCVARWTGTGRLRALLFAVRGTWRQWRAGELDSLDWHGRKRVGL